MKKLSFLAFFLAATLSMWSQMPMKQIEKQKKSTVVSIETNVGKIVVSLYDDTPKHRENFIKLVENHTYEGLLFHRVIKNFMVQAGDPKSAKARPGEPLGDGTLGYTVPAEIRPNHFHKRGALCAARQGDNVNPRRESSASQFYIVQGNKWDGAQLDMMEKRFGKKFSGEQRKVYASVGGTPHLDGEYTVFGEVVEGMEVVDMIAASSTDNNDRPLKDVRILKVSVIK